MYRRNLGFGVFIDIWSMPLCPYCSEVHREQQLTDTSIELVKHSFLTQIINMAVDLFFPVFYSSVKLLFLAQIIGIVKRPGGGGCEWYQSMGLYSSTFPLLALKTKFC
jgi:hypothetical protein